MAEQGVAVDGRLSQELLTSLFAHGAALHDGAVIVRGETIVAAAVTLPLSEDVRVQGRIGTRHRAALGITEQTDALAIVVSEERGTIGLATGGTMTSDLEPERLRVRLVELLDPQSVPKRARRMAQRGSRTLRGKRVRGGRRARHVTAATTAPAATIVPSGDPPARTPSDAPDPAPAAPPTSRTDRTASSVGARGVGE